MNDIRLVLNERGQGAFVIEEEGERVAEMDFGISKNVLSVYHTEVAEKLQGQGIAPRLLDSMVTYAREQNLKVKPYCPYVLVQFKRHEDKYADLWYR